jgi:hypothetical protein
MPFVEVFTREELSDAVRATLAETLLVTMMNIEIGHPTDHARSIGWVWFHTLPGASWAVGGRRHPAQARPFSALAHGRVSPSCLLPTTGRPS